MKQGFFAVLAILFLIFSLPKITLAADIVFYPKSTSASSYSPNLLLSFTPDSGGCGGGQDRSVLEGNYLRGTLRCGWVAGPPSNWETIAHSTCEPGCTTTHYIGQIFKPADSAQLPADLSNNPMYRVKTVRLSGWFKIGTKDNGHSNKTTQVRVSLYRYSGDNLTPITGNAIASADYTFTYGTGNRSYTDINLPSNFSPAGTPLYLEIKQLDNLDANHIIWLPVHHRWTSSSEHKAESNTMFDNGRVYASGMAYAGDLSNGNPVYDSNSRKTEDDLGQITILGDILDAKCESIAPPANFSTSQTVTASITMKNTGNIPWTAADNDRLGSQDAADNYTWGYNRVPLSITINSQSLVTFTYSFTAPATAGTYNFNWQMLRENAAWFGQKCVRSVSVPQTGTATSPVINSLQISNSSESQISLSSAQGDEKSSGLTSLQSGSNWKNPMTVTLNANPPSGKSITGYYVFLYDVLLEGVATPLVNPHTSISSILSNPLDSILADNFKALLIDDPKKGVLLAFDASSSPQKYFVWDWNHTSANKWRQIPVSGWPICSSLPCTAQSLLYTVFQENSTPAWKIQFDQNFGSKHLYTASYVKVHNSTNSQIESSDFKADCNDASSYGCLLQY